MTDNQQPSVEHLNIVQNVIARMSGNSTQMKTWAVSLVTAAFVFSGLSNDPHWLIAVGGCIPVIAFWTMDTKYLHLERCYIKLYERAIKGNPHTPFDLNHQPYVSAVEPVWRIAFSWSVCTFYAPLLAVMLVLLAILAT